MLEFWGWFLENHQDVLEKIQVAEGALRPIPQGSGPHLVTDVRVEGCLLEKERNVDLLKQEEPADKSPTQQCRAAPTQRQETLAPVTS